ncbi:DUF7344 domain-containing protein [Halobacteriaceae archaeon SHR40]|uniref:DUF7344 domain-containing protein n=1 Tax=Halovenus amylolytica TaxID=2500550 RepID=UPI000FE37C5C
MTLLEKPRPIDRTFDLLRHPVRRRILSLVIEHDARSEDAFSVADIETEDDAIELPTVELSHSQLPKLTEVGYIEWDVDTNTIQQRSNCDEIAPLLDWMAEDELLGGGLAQ